MLSAYATALPPSVALPPFSSPLLVVDAHVLLVALAATVAIAVGVASARRRARVVERRPWLRVLDGRKGPVSRHAA